MSHIPPYGSGQPQPTVYGHPPQGGYAYVPTPVMMPVYQPQVQPQFPPQPQPYPPVHSHYPPPDAQPHYPPAPPPQYQQPFADPSQQTHYYPPPPPSTAESTPHTTYITNHVYQPPPPQTQVTVIEETTTIVPQKPWQAIAGLAASCLAEVSKQVETNVVTVCAKDVAIEWLPSTISSASSLAHRAFVGGKEGWERNPIWIIRAHHNGELVPGKLSINSREANIPHGGREVPVHNFEILCVPQHAVRWVPAANGQVPVGAIVAGRTHTGEPLYISRVKHMLRSSTPGKVHPSHGCAYISYNGSETSYRNYEVLCKIC